MKQFKITPGLVCGIICGACIGVAIALVVSPMLSVDEYKTSCAEAESELAELQDELALLESVSADDAETINANLYSAATIGRTVAELQSNYQTLNSALMLDADAISENAEALSEYFDSSVSNGATPWFVATEDGYTASWEFETTYSFATSSIDVIWLCYIEETGELAAYATATYDAETNTFSDLTYANTSIGATYIAATSDSTSGTDLDALIESIQDVVDIDDDITDEDLENLQEQSDARQALRDLYGGDD